MYAPVIWRIASKMYVTVLWRIVSKMYVPVLWRIAWKMYVPVLWRIASKCTYLYFEELRQKCTYLCFEELRQKCTYLCFSDGYGIHWAHHIPSHSLLTFGCGQRTHIVVVSTQIGACHKSIQFEVRKIQFYFLTYNIEVHSVFFCQQLYGSFLVGEKERTDCSGKPINSLNKNGLGNVNHS